MNNFLIAQIQEEILWLCEAAHIPIVWATQVLETLSKKGRPSRAEIIDATMAERAECVMLNKGPHIIETIKILDEILNSMQDYHHKKAPMLPPLKVFDPGISFCHFLLFFFRFIITLFLSL